jgi:hypothetical protein
MVVVKECQYSYVLVCKYKYYKPSYVCFLKLSEKFYYIFFQTMSIPLKLEFYSVRDMIVKIMTMHVQMISNATFKISNVDT